MSFSHWGVVLFENPMGEYKEIEGTISAFKELSDLTIFRSESNPSGQKKRLPNPPWLSRSPSGNGSLRNQSQASPHRHPTPKFNLFNYFFMCAPESLLFLWVCVY